MNDTSLVIDAEVWGVLSTVVALLAYAAYFWGIIRHGTVPHFVTWLVWAIFAGLAFFVQSDGGGGAGAWANGIGAICCGVIAIFGIYRGRGQSNAIDMLCLLAALAAGLVWRLSDSPLLAISIVTCADVISIVPTIRKSLKSPRGETLTTFGLTALRHFLSILAMEKLSIVTLLYPATLIASNLGFVILILRKRKTEEK